MWIRTWRQNNVRRSLGVSYMKAVRPCVLYKSVLATTTD
jgi:hypothetical protein